MPDEKQQPARDGKQPSPPAVWPPFSPRVLTRQLVLDAAARWAVLAMLFVGVIGDWTYRDATWPNVVFVLAVVAWVGINVMTTRVARAMAGIEAVIAAMPAQAEAVLAGGLIRWPLLRSTRLLLYHKLASLRHAQHRFAESAAICRSLLALKLGQVERHRVDLMVMLAEASLRLGDIGGAYQAISGMYGRPLSLLDQLRLLALQTRYEVTAGHDAFAVASIDAKVRMAELLPAPVAGAVHGMLATAAARLGKVKLAAWLSERAQLLATPEQMDDVTGMTLPTLQPELTA